jgi:hypothetical protein
VLSCICFLVFLSVHSEWRTHFSRDSLRGRGSNTKAKRMFFEVQYLLLVTISCVKFVSSLPCGLVLEDQ